MEPQAACNWQRLAATFSSAFNLLASIRAFCSSLSHRFHESSLPAYHPHHGPVPLAPHRSTLISILFEDIICSSTAVFSHSAILCFQELCIMLQRIQTLLEDSSNGSRMWLLLQTESLANSFHAIRDSRRFKLQRGAREPPGIVPEEIQVAAPCIGM
ncbi:hypothetical protein DVH24_002123 [Malus domestica]|uniref:Uncharacterized protein n=1 Tax=Malus domestica TaxID=3750 RepID=A0A498I973_MALDO|nr:hypothetical protein DVH24_002123 [Malus domestica]